jgi:hypothetical protein
MPSASLVLDPAYAIGPVPPRRFGSFVEHRGALYLHRLLRAWASSGDFLDHRTQRSAAAPRTLACIPSSATACSSLAAFWHFARWC